MNWNYELVKNYVNKLGYSLIDIEYKNVKSKLTIKDNEGYFYKPTITGLQHNNVPSKFGNGNPYTIQNIRLWIKLNNFKLELISEKCIDTREKLIFKDMDGYFYFSNFSNILTGNYPSKFHKTNPYSIQNIKLWLKLNNKIFELISDIYTKNSQKLIMKDKKDYYYAINLANLKSSESHNKFGNDNPYTIQNINLWCKLNNKFFELVDDQKYKRNNLKLKWQCLKCGEIFEVNWVDIFAGGRCLYCSGHKVGLSNCLATKNPELAKEWHPTKNGDLTPYDVTSGVRKNVWWQCEKGHEWPALIFNRSRKNGKATGCPYCSGRFPTEENNLLKINPELCEEWDYKKNDKRPEDYLPNSGKYVWWICRECGHEWEARIGHRTGMNSGCPECNESKGEKEISNMFKIKDIFNIPQKTFDGLVGLGNGLLSYDFYIPKYNLLIEYQGEQHERFCRGVHKTKKDFERQQEHDRRKKEYALSNRYNFLEIWYYDFDRIETILESTINELKG